jgi:hypothetical protein
LRRKGTNNIGITKFILKKIREIKPNFNIGVSTGIQNAKDKWLQPYRHWRFIPKEHCEDTSKYK